LHDAIQLRALCGADLVTYPTYFGGNETLLPHRVTTVSWVCESTNEEHEQEGKIAVGSRVAANRKTKEEEGPADVQSLDLVDSPLRLQNVSEHACHQTRRGHPTFIREPGRYTCSLLQFLPNNSLPWFD